MCKAPKELVVKQYLKQSSANGSLGIKLQLSSNHAPAFQALISLF